MADRTRDSRFSLTSTLTPEERGSHETSRTQPDSEDEIELLRSEKLRMARNVDAGQRPQGGVYERDAPHTKDTGDEGTEISETTAQPQHLTDSSVKLPIPSVSSAPTPLRLSTVKSDEANVPPHTTRQDSTLSNAVAGPPLESIRDPRIRSPLPTLGPQIPVDRLEGGPLRHKLNLSEEFGKFTLTRTHARRRGLFAVFVAVLCVSVVGSVWGIKHE